MEKTTQTKRDVGNYFVANYPPFSFWKPDYVEQAQEVIASAPKEQTPLGLYMHIPFCRKRCKFCYFRVYTDKNKKQRDTYLEALVKELATYSQMPITQGRPPSYLYMGGGTPSALNEQQLAFLGENLRKLYSWENLQEFTFECEPGTLSKRKLETIKDLGVTRLSLGIENFNGRILEENGRAHRREEVLNAYQWAREVGFPQINIDLIAGMLGESEENWQSCIEEALELCPDSITIYQMELPFNTKYAKSILSGEDLEVADWPTKRRWTKEAFDRLLAGGYQKSSAYTVTLPSENSTFLYRDSLWHGGDMIGTGVASFSYAQQIHFQNADKFEPYVEQALQGKIPLARAFPTSERNRLIREMILQLKLGKISVAAFQEKFQVDISQEFDHAFQELIDENLVEQDGKEIRVTPEGLLQVDSLLPLFYEQQYQNARYT